jgi:hypothetical protein
MTYQIEAYRWGSDLFDPAVITLHSQELSDARLVAESLWLNPLFFHVRFFAPSGIDHPEKYDLHYLRTRPVEDRSLEQSFQKIDAVVGVRTSDRHNKINALRTCDFVPRVPVSGLRLKASEHLYRLDDFEFEAIKASSYKTGSIAISFDDFETCLAAAALIPGSMDPLFWHSEEDWYYLSEVDLKNDQAFITFSLASFKNP